MYPFIASALWYLWLPGSAGAAHSEVSRHELQTMVAEVAPVVGEVAGRRFDRLPEVVLADEAILAEVVLRERLYLLSTVEGLTPEQAGQRAAELASQQLALGFEGKYGFVDDRLYISVDRVVATLFRNRAPSELLRPVLRVIIAHELAHALQDQHTEMDRLLRTAGNDDAVMAMNCAFEGHAVWVHEAAAAALGLDDAAELMAGLMGYEVPIDSSMGPEQFYSRYVYGAGRDFVAHHARSGGADAVWSVLSSPPRSTAEIVAPERYPEPAPRVSGTLQEVLDRAMRRLSRREWSVRQATIGDYDLREQLLRAGGRLDVADGMTEGWSLTSVGAHDDGSQVQVLRFVDPVHARRYVEQMQRRARVQAKTAATLPFLDVTVGEFGWVPGDVAVETSVAFELDEGARDQQSQRWVVRGTDVVQVLTVNHEPGRRRSRGVFRAVFRALEAR